MAAYTTYLDQLLSEITGVEVDERFGYKFTAATIGNTSLTSTDPNLAKLAANAPSDRFNGWHLYLATAAESFTATTLSVSATGTATLNFVGPTNATNQAGATSVYLLKVGWVELRELFNDALDLETVECITPLMHGGSDMQGSSVDSDFTESNATDTVQATASEVNFGQQSLVVTDSGSGGGYTQTALYGLGQGKQAMVHGIVKSDTGTSVLQVLDGDGNVQDSITTTQEWWVYMGKQVSFDAADEQLRLRLTESTVSAAGDWNAAWFVRLDEGNFRLPSWIDQRFRLKSVGRMVYHSVGSEDSTWMADSGELLSLNVGEDYRFIKREADVNKALVWVDPKWLTHPLWLTVEAPASAPYGVTTTFSTDASTNNIEVLRLVPRAKMLIGKRYSSFATWGAQGEQEVRERMALRDTAPPKRQPVIRRVFG